MQSEAFYLSQVIQAESPEGAWNGVVGLARDVGIAAVIKTRYRNAGVQNGKDAVKLELPQLYLDPALSAQDSRLGGSREKPSPSSILWSIAPADHDAVCPRFDETGLPVTTSAPRDAADPFVERFLRTLRVHHGIDLQAVLTVSGTPPADDIVSEFLHFFADKALAPDTISLLGSVAGTYAGKAAVLAAPGDGDSTVALKPMEVECIRWAVAGKSLQDIADILDISYRSVRYQIDQARERYGYATNLQTYVRAAADYGLDPMTPPDPEADGMAGAERDPRGDRSQ